jgi:hypothetical protein
MLFTAVALDSEGATVHGLLAEWESSDKRVVFVSKQGQAVAGGPGHAILTAKVGRAGQSVNVVVEGTSERFGGKKRQNTTREPRRISQNSTGMSSINPASGKGSPNAAATKRQHASKVFTEFGGS